MTAATLDHAKAALRGGRSVGIGGWSVLAVETASAEMLALADPDQRAPILISGQRAAVLGLGNARDAASPAEPVRIARVPWLNGEAALALVDPAQDGSRAPLGPLSPVPIEDPELARAALALARRAGLLPALWLIDRQPGQPHIEPGALDLPPQASIVARARLPIAGIDDAQMIGFRDPGSGDEHVALLIGAFGGKPPLTRLHSECLTGDVFHSLKCDCGPQLDEALRLIVAAGGGVLLYLRQEGRGIGLANKLRAYQLQDRGLDTIDSNRRLGFADDERDYGIAAAMLRALGVEEVRLLTNNPAKVDGLVAAGIAVAERVAHHLPANPHNADYLATKRARSGHLD